MLGARETAPTATGPAGSPRRRAARLGGLFLLLLALCTPVVALHAHHNRPLFVLDEFAYADYLYKIASGHLVPHRGEVSGQPALRALACRGYTPSIWNDRPPTDAPSYAPTVSPKAATTPAVPPPPTSFLLTYPGARGLGAAGVAGDVV